MKTLVAFCNGYFYVLLIVVIILIGGIGYWLTRTRIEKGEAANAEEHKLILQKVDEVEIAGKKLEIRVAVLEKK